jgi:hypothetical protein
MIGLASAAGLIGHFLSTEKLGDIESAKSTLATVSALPGAGLSPLLLTAARVDTPTAVPQTLRATLRIPRPELEQWITAVVAAVD